MFIILNYTNFFSDNYNRLPSSDIRTLYSAGTVELRNPSFSFKLERDGQDIISRERTLLPYNCSDYGNGFYLCEDYRYAEKWLNMYFDGTGIINKYTLDMTGLEPKVFNIDNNYDMLQYICLLLDNSNAIPYDNIEHVQKFLHDNFDRSIYDEHVIIGPRLDSSYMRINRALSSEDIDVNLFRDFIRLYDLSDQVYLQSEKAFSRIEFVSSSIVSKQDNYNSYREDYESFIVAKELSKQLLNRKGLL